MVWKWGAWRGPASYTRLIEEPRLKGGGVEAVRYSADSYSTAQRNTI